MQHFWQQFLTELKATRLEESIAVFSGIASVWLSKKENIWLYPIGLINTILYIHLSLEGHLIGEASVNLYYTIVSIWGWVLWARRDQRRQHVLHITFSTGREWLQQIGFFLFFYVALFLSLTYLKRYFPGAIPPADAFASATAYTGMWLMARKKVESWYWWIATDIASVPLYFVKGYAFTSVYYFILTLLAFSGLVEWQQRARRARTEPALS